MNRPVRVLHLELPRALTTTVKPVDFRSAGGLARRGVFLDHADLNTDFWQHVISPLGLGDLFAPGLNPGRVAALGAQLRELRRRFELPLTVFGFDFGAAARSSLAIEGAIAPAALRHFVRGYLDSIAARLDLAGEGLRAVSLGIDSAQSLVFACALARELRERVPRECRVILGRHSYENFSLALRRADLEANGVLARFFDAVIWRKEFFVEEIAGLCAARPLVDAQFSPSAHAEKTRFMALLALPPERCVLLQPLSRNKCYWKKCSFCVQIRKHAADAFYDDADELPRAFEELAALCRLGFRYCVFDDEAVSPANLRRLCDYLEGAGLDLHWTVRIIADPGFRSALIRRMADQGCFEVLFGLETVSRSTAAAMRKVSSKAGAAEIAALLRSFAGCGIGIFLNFIYAFPTEPDGEFLESLRFLEDVKREVPGITAQLNKFALFIDTQVYREPGAFGLAEREAATREEDLRISFDYLDRFGRRASSAPSASYFAASLDMTPEEYSRRVQEAGMEVVETAFQLNYASFGLIGKHQGEPSLFRYCW